MLTTYGGSWSQLCLILPLLALTGLGLGLGIAISSSGILENERVSALELNTKESSESIEMFYLSEELPTFSNLRQIYLLMKIDFVFGLQNVAALTIACPHLQRLHLVVEGSNRCSLGGVRSSPGYHVHLKEVEFGGFFGLQNEISLILYLLKSAVALEQMLISRDYRYYTGGGRWDKTKEAPFDKKELETFHQQLQGQAASSTARVIIR